MSSRQTLTGPGYSHKAGFKALYGVLKKNSVESDVDELWTYILRRYFLNDDSNEDYSIALQQRPRDGSTKTRADIIIKTISKGSYQKIIFVEDKRVSLEGHGSTWSRACDQLYGYMLASKKARHAEKNRTLYGIVTVGRYSRFYELKSGSNSLQDYSGSTGRYYEFQADEDEIDRILLEIKRLTS